MQLDKKQETMFNADFLAQHLALNDRQVKELTSCVGKRTVVIPIDSIRRMLELCLQLALSSAHPTRLSKAEAKSLKTHITKYDELSKSLQERGFFPNVLPQGWLRNTMRYLEAVEGASRAGSSGAPKNKLNAVLYPALWVVYEIAFDDQVRKSDSHTFIDFVIEFIKAIRRNIDAVENFKECLDETKEWSRLSKGAVVHNISDIELEFTKYFLSVSERSAIRRAISQLKDEEIESKKSGCAHCFKLQTGQHKSANYCFTRSYLTVLRSLIDVSEPN